MSHEPSASPELLIVWVHPESRTRIYVYPDHKRRVLYSHAGNSQPDVDEWPILWRRDTPELTDEEWQGKPWAEGWVQG